MSDRQHSELSNETQTVTKHENSRCMFYKKPINKDNLRLNIEDEECHQEIRRRRLLIAQKKSRDEAFNAARTIVDVVLDSEEEHVEENVEEMEVSRPEHDRTQRRYRQYTNKLMLSEWMLNLPEDYSNNWLIVPCPEGRRTLLVACKGKTRAYSRRGERLGKFNSSLPGGNSHSRSNSNTCTILDCIWLNKKKMYYALDVLAWSNQTLLNCDTEFRFFWLKSKFEDTCNLQSRHPSINAFPILPLPNAPCHEDVATIIADSVALEPLDGFLFYHREAQYTNGRTPLVTWLKPFMLDEVLGIMTPDCFSRNRPDDYVDYRRYIDSHTTKSKSKTFAETEMDVNVVA